MGQENKAIDLTPIGKTKFSIKPLAVVEIKGAQWFEFSDYDFEKKS